MQNLLELYKKYNIENLSHGKLEDALGDVFEEYTRETFSSKNLDVYQEQLKREICEILNLDNLVATKPSSSIIKTDVILSANGQRCAGISVKQTKRNKVTIGEFSVADIVSKLNIDDAVLISLLMKFQTDGSAKNFTVSQKQEMKTRLQPYAYKLVKWLYGGDNTDASIIVRFKIKANNQLVGLSVKTIEQQVFQTMHRKDGTVMARAGFSTGLAWTYATGTKGSKIQFKG